MIDYEFFNYLKNDLTLRSLLLANGDDAKIYPLSAPQGKEKPHIVYFTGDIGGAEELLKEIRITTKITADDFETVKSISDRLLELLDMQSDIQGYWKPAGYIIFHCINNGGGDLPKIKQGDITLSENIRVLHFDIKYKKK
jgi:hypothetical protein